jgi:uncharacterized protein YggL (DUF469 family)
MASLGSSLATRFLLLLIPVFLLRIETAHAQRVMIQGPINIRGQVNADVEDEDEEAWQQGAFPRMTRQSMRESLFSGLGGSETAFQKTQREKIRREIDRVDSVCALTEEQKEKLDIAIDIEIQRLLAKIEMILGQFDSKMTVQQFQQMQVQVQQLVGTIPSKKAETEIWRRVLNSQLTPAQKQTLASDTEIADRNQLRTNRLKILLSLQRKLGLTKTQREAINTWLEKENRSKLNFSAVFKLLPHAKELSNLWTPAQMKALLTPIQQEIELPIPLDPIDGRELR